MRPARPVVIAWALLVVGGWNAYLAAKLLHDERSRYPGFAIPIACVPASIDNNLPGSESSIGADTALNEIVEAIDAGVSLADSGEDLLIAALDEGSETIAVTAMPTGFPAAASRSSAPTTSRQPCLPPGTCSVSGTGALRRLLGQRTVRSPPCD